VRNKGPAKRPGRFDYFAICVRQRISEVKESRYQKGVSTFPMVHQEVVLAISFQSSRALLPSSLTIMHSRLRISVARSESV
jgi:hypothetical protein